MDDRPGGDIDDLDLANLGPNRQQLVLGVHLGTVQLGVVSVREVQRVEAGLVRDVAAVELVQTTGQDTDTLALPAAPQPDTAVLTHGDNVLAPGDDGGVRDELGVLCQCHRTVSGAGGPDLDPHVRPGLEDDEAAGIHAIQVTFAPRHMV